MLGIWGAVLEVVRCVGHAQSEATARGQKLPAGTVLEANGAVSWPVVEVTRLLCAALPHDAVNAAASWGGGRELVARSRAAGMPPVVGDAVGMERVMAAAQPVLSLYAELLAALRASAEAGGEAAWEVGRTVTGQAQDWLEALQASPGLAVYNLQAYAGQLAALTGVGDGSSGGGGTAGYAVSHLTGQVFGSGTGDSRGECFRTVAGAGDAAGFEARLLQHHALALRVLEQTVFWSVRMAAAGTESSHPLAVAALGDLAQALMRLWQRPLPGAIKAGIVRVLTALVDESTSSGGALNLAPAVLDGFVSRAMLPVAVVGPHREGTPALAGAQGPSALMYELLLLDRGRGEYQHTLALIALLTALSRPGAGALTVAEGLRLLHVCAPMLPSTTSAGMEGVFCVPAQRWQVWCVAGVCVCV